MVENGLLFAQRVHSARYAPLAACFLIGRPCGERCPKVLHCTSQLQHPSANKSCASVITLYQAAAHCHKGNMGRWGRQQEDHGITVITFDIPCRAKCDKQHQSTSHTIAIGPSPMHKGQGMSVTANQYQGPTQIPRTHQLVANASRSDIQCTFHQRVASGASTGAALQAPRGRHVLEGAEAFYRFTALHSVPITLVRPQRPTNRLRPPAMGHSSPAAFPTAPETTVDTPLQPPPPRMRRTKHTGELRWWLRPGTVADILTRTRAV